MNRDAKSLGLRAVACKHWRWMPGMLIVDHGAGTRFLWEDEFFLHGMHEESEGSWMRMRKDRERHPNLSDPATLGCLLSLVRQAYADPAFCIQCVAGYWYEDSEKRELVPRSNETEAEALVAALEAAP